MRPLALSLVVLSLAACNAGTGPEVGNQVGLGFQLARTPSASALAAALASPDGPPLAGDPPVITTTAAGLRITRDADVILITKAQFVVRNVSLRSALATCADDDDIGSSLRASSSDDDDDCPTLRVGPFLVDMSVTGPGDARVAVPVPAGTYSSLSLRLHKVTSNDSSDAAFRRANPDFRDISVRLEGTYNGTAFVFVNDVNAKMTVPLPEPLTIGTGGSDVTVSVDVSSWFLRPQGGLYPPASANVPGAVRAAVQNNIKSAFRAFRDRNRDGRQD